jgi:hypothetical protein
MRHASGIDGGEAAAAAMIGVDSGRSGAVSQASVPVLLPASVSAFPLVGRRTGTEALETRDTLMPANRRSRRRLNRS